MTPRTTNPHQQRLQRLQRIRALFGYAGLIAHGMWMALVVLVFAGAAFGLHDRLTAWVQAQRGSTSGPAYVIAYGYIGNTATALLALAFVCNAAFILISLRRQTVTARIRDGLCPACAYPVGVSDKCTECGGAVQPRRGAGM